MYDDEVQAPMSLTAVERYYRVAKFPTKNIKSPIVLVYGGSDSLIDIEAMLRELPRHTDAFEVPHFEHLDFLWAEEVSSLVFPHVLGALSQYAVDPRHRRGSKSMELAPSRSSTALDMIMGRLLENGGR